MEIWIVMPSALKLLSNKRVRLTVRLFGRTTVLAGTLLKYSKPFVVIQTKQATRLLNENAIKEIVPVEGNLLTLMELLA